MTHDFLSPPEPPPAANDPLLRDLTPAQREAVTTVDGPLLVLAGAGSGKTRVITRRIAYLIARGVPPTAILAITFTNKAAREMAERVAQTGRGRGVWISTFHSMGARILRHNAERLGYPTTFSIYDQADSLSVVKQAMKDLEIDPDAVKPAAVLHIIGEAKTRMTTPAAYAEANTDPFGKRVAMVFERYQKTLKQNHALDFNDLLGEMVRLFDQHPDVLDTYRARFRYLLVDEYQDTNRIQYRLVKQLAGDNRNVCVTGDPDQSIYGWRGADIRNILDFERDYRDAKTVVLEENFRSVAAILRVADALIAHNRERKSKSLKPVREVGAPVRHMVCNNEWDEARHIALAINEAIATGRRKPSDIAILYRVNSLSRVLEGGLRDAGIPYTIVGSVAFYQRKEIKTLLGYLRLVTNPADDTAFEKVVNEPARGIGGVSVAQLRAMAAEAGVPMLHACRLPGMAAERAGKKLAAFASIIERIGKVAAERPVTEIVRDAIALSGLRGALEISKDPRALEQLENLNELVSAAAEHDARNDEATLQSFLEEVALVSDVDNWQQQQRVTLMTLHSAKGLEFPMVFLAGMEEGLLPHARSADTEKQIEEERRLCYVGITRAQDELILTSAQTRAFQGASAPRQRSTFLDQVPETLIEEVNKARSYGGGMDDYDDDDFNESPSRGPSRSRPQGPSNFHRPSDARRPSGPAAFRGRKGAPRPKPEPVGNGGGAFSGGDTVRHPVFGIGIVLSSSGTGENEKVMVFFKSKNVTKTLVAKYAHLEKTLP